MRWNSRGVDEGVEVCRVLEGGSGRSVEGAVRGTGLGVKVLAGLVGDGLVAVSSELGDGRIDPQRVVPLKPVKVAPPPGTTFGRSRALLTSLNSS